MVAYLIIPGIGGSDEKHWQTCWEHQWGPDAVRIAPASWSQPELPDWVEAIGRAAESALARADEVILVAHSLGCWAAASWLNSAAAVLIAAVRGAFLVAPPDPSGPAFPVAEAPTFASAQARPLPRPSTVLASTDDPYCTVEVSTRLAADWGSTLHVLGELGHLNSASNLGLWPQGQELLQSLLAR